MPCTWPSASAADRLTFPPTIGELCRLLMKTRRTALVPTTSTRTSGRRSGATWATGLRSTELPVALPARRKGHLDPGKRTGCVA